MAVVAYPGAQAAAVLGLLDLFGMAERLRSHADPARPALLAHRVDVDDSLPRPAKPWSALILPPALGAPPVDPSGRLPRWIGRRHDEGTLVCSVCAGAFLLGATGLLAGRPATTHWALGPDFARAFPDVHLDTDRLLVDDGDLITAGGMMAWVDLGLRLIDRFLGPTLMLATARRFLVDPGGREQRFYTPFAPQLTHGDEAILKAQHWLQRHAAGEVIVTELARRAGLEPRTFLRRFSKATGLTPIAYLQHLRVGLARERLERTGDSVEAIAWRVGYADSGAFRKIFIRLLGLSPGEYRRRFGRPGAPPSRGSR